MGPVEREVIQTAGSYTALGAAHLLILPAGDLAVELGKQIGRQVELTPLLERAIRMLLVGAVLRGDS